MKKLILFSAIAIAIYLSVKTVNKPALKYFKPTEFGLWYPLMSNELLQKLDAFRAAWGYPVIVSTAHGAIGREGDGDSSQHNVTKWGEVRAIDVFPTLGSGKYITTPAERDRAYQIAKQVGFTGIGLYTDTKPGNMLHVDVRKDKVPGSPATWSRIGGQYRSIGEVIG